MGIQALPADAVRTIGASQVLHDATAVVKELLDNALDAHATSVAIEISTNTIDSIQVRDNGRGIPAVDRNLVARPHCTSKISTEGDLRAIGGSSLGFRGEALASIAEISGSLTISTRVEGEQVSTTLKINQRGEVDGYERGSLPIGTTVKATDFMKSNPVRKQVALKSAEKTLAKIKQMLQSYAFARPSIRVSLRVLKAKNESGNWLYAPKPNANAEDVVLKIAGTRCTSQCAWSIMEDQGFTLQAFLPTADADASKVAGFGYFISIDARPVSPSRGITKQIVKIFREMLKKVNKFSENIKDPFIYLQLSCPPLSYDANVEPGKDDVLFENPDIVLELARRLFDAVYSTGEVINMQSTTQTNAFALTIDSHSNTNDPLSPGTQAALNEPWSDLDFEAVGIGQDLPPPAAEALASHRGPAHEHIPREMARKAFRSNMYGCDEEDLDLLDARPPTGRTEADFKELRQARKDVTLSNPWVIAKMNAPARRAAEAPDELQHGVMESIVPETACESSTLIARPAIDLEAPGLPTPRPSSPSPPQSSFHPSDHVPVNSLARNGRLIGPQTFPSSQRSTESRYLQTLVHDDDGLQHHLHQAPMYDYAMSSRTPHSEVGTGLHEIPNASQRHRRANNNQQSASSSNPPFRPPANRQGHGDGLRSGQADKRAKRPPRDTAGLVVQGELGDLLEDPHPLTPPQRNRDMRDFVTTLDLTADESASSIVERRDFAQNRRAMSFDSVVDPDNTKNNENRPPPPGILSGRGFVPASELTALEARIGTLSSDNPKPRKRRRTGTAHVLTEISPNEDIEPSTDHDQLEGPKEPNRSISRGRGTAGEDKSRRTKSSQLPLERIPNGHALQNVTLLVSTSEETMAKAAAKIDEERSLPAWKRSAFGEYHGFTSKPNPEALSKLVGGLHDLLPTRLSDGKIVHDLADVLSDAFDAHFCKSVDAIFT